MIIYNNNYVRGRIGVRMMKSAKRLSVSWMVSFWFVFVFFVEWCVSLGFDVFVWYDGMVGIVNKFRGNHVSNNVRIGHRIFVFWNCLDWYLSFVMIQLWMNWILCVCSFIVWDEFDWFGFELEVLTIGLIVMLVIGVNEIPEKLMFELAILSFETDLEAASWISNCFWYKTFTCVLKSFSIFVFCASNIRPNSMNRIALSCSWFCSCFSFSSSKALYWALRFGSVKVSGDKKFIEPMKQCSTGNLREM